MKQLRIGYLSTMYHSSHILKRLRLLEAGLGLEPMWRLFGTGPAMVEAFAAEELDIGYIGLPPLLIAVGRGVPIVCISGGHCEGTVVLGSKDMRPLRECGSPLTVLQQFSGKKIGVPAQGSIHDIIIRHTLAGCGLDTDCVVNYHWADLIADDVRKGSLDGAVGTPPLAVMCQKWYGQKILLPPGSLWPFNPSYGIAAHTRMLAEPGLLRDFLRLHENACNMTRCEPDRAASVIAQNMKVIDAAFVRDVFAVSPRYCASLPEEYIESTMKFVPVLQKMGHLKGKLSADQVFNCSLIETTHPEPPHY